MTTEETNEKLKDSGETISATTNEYETEGYASAIAIVSSIASSRKATTKPTESPTGRKCNGPPCLTPYATTVRGETRDFYRILKELNNNNLDSHSSDFLIRK